MYSYYQLLVNQNIGDRIGHASPTVASGAHREIGPVTLRRTVRERPARLRGRVRLGERLLRLPLAVVAWCRSRDKFTAHPSHIVASDPSLLPAREEWYWAR